MKVTLLAHSILTTEAIDLFASSARGDQFAGSDAERLTEIAGRICYDSFGKGRNSRDYHQHIFDVGHGSVLEHSTVTVLISGVSRGLTHELIRHRVGTAVSQRSTRYVDEDHSLVVEHPKLTEFLHGSHTNYAENSFINSLRRDAFKANRELYRHVADRVEFSLVKDGVDKQTARKQARGAARGFLENGMETELVFTMNLRAMLNIISQRAVGAADAEIRQLACEFVKIGKQVAPAYFNRIEIIDGQMTNNPKDVRI